MPTLTSLQKASPGVLPQSQNSCLAINKSLALVGTDSAFLRLGGGGGGGGGHVRQDCHHSLLVTWHQSKNPQDGSCGTDCPHALPRSKPVVTRLDFSCVFPVSGRAHPARQPSRTPPWARHAVLWGAMHIRGLPPTARRQRGACPNSSAPTWRGLSGRAPSWCRERTCAPLWRGLLGRAPLWRGLLGRAPPRRRPNNPAPTWRHFSGSTPPWCSQRARVPPWRSVRGTAPSWHCPDSPMPPWRQFSGRAPS